MAETEYVISVTVPSTSGDLFQRLGVGKGGNPEQAARDFFGQLDFEDWPVGLGTPGGPRLMATPVRSTHLLTPSIDMNPRLSFVYPEAGEPVQRAEPEPGHQEAVLPAEPITPGPVSVEDDPDA